MAQLKLVWKAPSHSHLSPPQWDRKRKRENKNRSEPPFPLSPLPPLTLVFSLLFLTFFFFFFSPLPLPVPHFLPFLKYILLELPSAFLMNSAMSCGGPIGTCCKWLYLLTEAIITAPCQLPTPCQRNTLQHSLCILLLFSQETSEFTDVNSVQDPVPFNLKKKKEKYFTELNS